MRILKRSLPVLFTLIGYVSIGQEEVKGTVVDEITGQGIYDAFVSVNGVKKARTDDEGKFIIRLQPGDYAFSASNFIEGYLVSELDATISKGGNNSITIKLSKDPSILQQETVVVKAGRNPDKSPKTDGDADKQRDKQEGTTEVVSTAAIRRSGASNALNVVQMTPGASVQDGKDVYIRGLGDRYTKTILNGMELPGLDPDKNSVQMDIFPAVLIDNITIYKSFTPKLYGDFTGGLIDIRTKDFPSKKNIYFKFSLGYNSRSTFNSDFIGYEGGKFDFLGFDDGTRSLPISPSKQIPHPIEGSNETFEATSAFGSTMATQKALSFLNQNYSFAIGDLKKVQNKNATLKFKYGYNFALNYRSQNNYFGDIQYNEYIRAQELDDNKLFLDRSSSGELATQDVIWTALLGQSLLRARSKYSLTLFHTQNGTSTAANLQEENHESNQAVLLKQGLQFTQRSVSNANLSGRHYLDNLEKHRLKLNWSFAPTYSLISDPDIRSTAVEVADNFGNTDEDVYLFEESVGAEIRRIFRSLSEINLSGKIDLEYKFSMWKNKDSLASKINFGGLHTYKSRSFDVSEYVFRLYGLSNEVPNDPNWFFEEGNLWSPETGQGTFATGQLEKANIYDANQNISSAYLMHDLPINSSFSINYGARVDKSVNRYTGQSNNADFDSTAPRYSNQVVLDTINILPSLNMVYKIRNFGKWIVNGEDSIRFERKTNFRASYAQTVARPSFREISISQIYDPIQGRRYLGNINLKPTLIHNAEFRWEHFFGRSELISATAFYKKFFNPIEIVANVAAPNEFMPVNAGQAEVYGGEFEVRKAVGFNTSGKRDYLSLIIGANFSYIVSIVDMNDIKTEVGGVTYTEKEVRQANARIGEIVGNYRPMFGQSPFVVNAFLNFKNDSLGLTCNLTYNVQGKKLAVVGLGSLPDVYEQPLHSLNFKASKLIGKRKMNPITNQTEERRWKIGVKGTNLLNSARQRFYEAYETESTIFDYMNQGMTFTGSITYTF
ncbi:TonB-dependent receptor plug domain-containing protein [Crocinitomicaceae bacterium]|nr:TonB-dependent receptor plug domain-containing protein [Crocinitomicaceae bacterium]